MRRACVAVILLVVVFSVGGCSKENPKGQGKQAEEDGGKKTSLPPFPGGPASKDRCSFEFAVYYLPRPMEEPVAVINTVAKEKFATWQLVKDADAKGQGAFLSARPVTQVQKNYPPPSIKSLRYFGVGLSVEQAQALQDCEKALVVDFSCPSQDIWVRMHEACELLETVARRTGGLIWDNATRQCFTPDTWHEHHLANWKVGEVPSLASHITIHSYKKTEYCRAVTLGMGKFGLPEVVVNDFSWSNNRPVGNLINVACQLLAEGRPVEVGGRLRVDLEQVSNPTVRQRELGSLKKNATKYIDVLLVKGERDEGDAENRIAEVCFDGHPGRTVHERQEAALSALWGSEDGIVRVTHDEKIAAASARAKTRLPELRTLFAKGLAPGEFIEVKAPFATADGGHEWMWVEVVSWKSGVIQGMLRNEPFEVPDLHAGANVTIREKDVFDYIHKFSDGREEGNETSQLIQQQSEATKQ